MCLPIPSERESLAYIRDQFGHHSIQVTVDIYGHLVPEGITPLWIGSTMHRSATYRQLPIKTGGMQP